MESSPQPHWTSPRNGKPRLYQTSVPNLTDAIVAEREKHPHSHIQNSSGKSALNREGFIPAKVGLNLDLGVQSSSYECTESLW